jgi:hypothetical protein
MSFKESVSLAAVIAGLVALPVASRAATRSCTAAAKPTAASYTWHFRAEATRLLNGIQVDAAKAQRHAATLESYADEHLSWQSNESQLDSIRSRVDDMGRKLCRLEQIRRVTAPWQQEAIGKVAPMVRLTADNLQDAINFLNRRQGSFWMPSYQKNVDNMYTETGKLSRSVNNLEEYASVHREDLHLAHELNLRAGA